MTTASAPGKIILFGEHAVVYGRPAIAAPVSQLRATATIENHSHSDVELIAPQIQRRRTLQNAPDSDPLALTLRLFQQAADLSFLSNIAVTVRSDIPIASGMGSGAAITAAVLRALAEHYQKPALLEPPLLSRLTYEVEKIHHGTPSGIDNTVVAYEQPLFFIRQEPQNVIVPFRTKRPLHFLIGMTGTQSQTRVVVGDVRRQWEVEPDRFETLFDACGEIAAAARMALEAGDEQTLGHLMNKNQDVLQQMTVSSPELDLLCDAANRAGALGAKLSGAGRGGNMIALVNADCESAVKKALYQTGATAVYITNL